MDTTIQCINDIRSAARTTKFCIDAMLVLALFAGTGAIDYALDNPLAALIALASLAYMALFAIKGWGDD